MNRSEVMKGRKRTDYKSNVGKVWALSSCLIWYCTTNKSVWLLNLISRLPGFISFATVLSQIHTKCVLKPDGIWISGRSEQVDTRPDRFFMHYWENTRRQVQVPHPPPPSRSIRELDEMELSEITVFFSLDWAELVQRDRRIQWTF